MTQPIIPADGVFLRPWVATDALRVLAAFSDDDIVRWHARRMSDPEEAAAYVRDKHARWAAETYASWAVTDPADVVLGQVGLRNLRLGDGTAEISYWVLPQGRRQGVARRALSAATQWAFQDVGLHRLTVMHAVVNTASCRVASAAGYDLEGTLRSAVRHADGWHDMHVHGRVRTAP
jgi:RimJ/RimL family protein N-acetyltransferase